MARKNILTKAPPYPVESAIKRLGENLRLARLRRNLTIEEVAEKIGTGPRAIMGAEKGKPTTSLATYVALLWIYDLMEPVNTLADSTKDEEGLAMSMKRKRARTKKTEGLDNDF
jgi:transcriptional regulator with XRE-family HTH domain